MNDILHLCSQSQSRRQLLEQSGILYKIIDHKSSECGLDEPHDFQAHVLAIAYDKLRHALLPDPSSIDKEYIFVLTADTLVRTSKSLQILGKPKDRDHAEEMLNLISQESIEIVTGCCLERMVKTTNGWEMSHYSHWSSSATAEFCIDPDMIDRYFEKVPVALFACGACVVEGIGQSFLKSFSGSYSGAMGIPLYELCQALKAMSFRF